ncbi:MAG: DUF4363 family protein [Ruminococcaceae bacterium]|nr:DUF4363 family protein [Oscillospiraceae bacterium]
MKASLISGILLLILLALVILNAVYIRHTMHDLKDLAQKFPAHASPQAVKQIQNFSDTFEKKICWLQLSVSYPMLDRISELGSMLEIYALAEAHSDYAATRALLLDAIKDVERLEKSGN